MPLVDGRIIVLWWSINANSIRPPCREFHWNKLVSYGAGTDEDSRHGKENNTARLNSANVFASRANYERDEIAFARGRLPEKSRVDRERPSFSQSSTAGSRDANEVRDGNRAAIFYTADKLNTIKPWCRFVTRKVFFSPR